MVDCEACKKIRFCDIYHCRYDNVVVLPSFLDRVFYKFGREFDVCPDTIEKNSFLSRFSSVLAAMTGENVHFIVMGKNVTKTKKRKAL